MRLGRRLAGHGSSSPLDEPDQRVVFVDCSAGICVPAGNVESSTKARSPTVEPLPSDVPSTTLSPRPAAQSACAGIHAPSIPCLCISTVPSRHCIGLSPISSVNARRRIILSVGLILPTEEAGSRGWESLADRPSTASVIVREARDGRSVELGVCRHEGIAVWFFFR